jgi:hypothetical protein
MRAMLANKYLLDGQAARALGLYQADLAERPEQPELRCRLILAQLALARVEEAAGLLLEVLEQRGPGALTLLAAGCQGFLPASAGDDPPALAGLRAVLAGELEVGRELLRGADPDRQPLLARLARALEDAHAP